jgi:hypothetical protein
VALQQHWSALATTGQPRNQVRALSLTRDDAHLTAEILQQSPDPVDALTLIARRVARVEAQQSLEELDGAILNGVQIHANTVSPIAAVAVRAGCVIQTDVCLCRAPGAILAKRFALTSVGSIDIVCSYRREPRASIAVECAGWGRYGARSDWGPATSPPREKGKARINPTTGGITVEYDFPEAGEGETYGEVGVRAVTASRNAAHAAAFKRGERCAPSRSDGNGRGHRAKTCKGNTQVRYGRTKVTIPAAGVYKIHVKPSSNVFTALKQGKTLDVHVMLVFTPAHTSTHIHEACTVEVRLARRHAH